MTQAGHPFYAFMLEAVELARLSRWQTAPNPNVGALLIKDGQVVARGRHERAGGDHAEVTALKDAALKGVNPAECVLVVTLEPCNHFGKTPPCSDTIIKAGIRRVIIGARDPNPEAEGGLERLREAGVEVEAGVAEEECLALIDNFILWQTTDLPYTILKLASTMDGRIATRTGHSKWITSPETRGQVHQLRRHMDAVMVGGNTFQQDDPKLTCRLDDPAHICEKQPLAVVVTSRLPEAKSSFYLLQERPESTMFWTTAAAAASPRAEALRRIGVRVLGMHSRPKATSHGYGMRAELDLIQGLRYLRQELGCHYVLCEGGGRLGLSLLDKGLARELHLHLAPKILGDNEATPLFTGRAPLLIDEALDLSITGASRSGADIMLTMRSLKAPELPQPGTER